MSERAVSRSSRVGNSVASSKMSLERIGGSESVGDARSACRQDRQEPSVGAELPVAALRTKDDDLWRLVVGVVGHPALL